MAPYAAAGATLRHIGDIHEDFLQIGPDHSSTLTRLTLNPDPLLMSGITATGGVSVKTRFVRVEPELLYTHWTSRHFLETTEELEFLLGITFR